MPSISTWQETNRICNHCEQTGFIRYRIWESFDGAYEDHQYECKNCDSVFWIDGIDS
jgi:hypothetical protein